MLSKTPEARREYARKWRANNPEKAQAQAAKSRAKNRDKINARQRAAYTPEKGRANNLKAQYGITPEEYQQMFDAQSGLCAICQNAATLHIDHNHTTDQIRELLCSPCNTGIGLFQEDKARLVAAAAYIQKHNKEP
jgi:hypothetical protein